MSLLAARQRCWRGEDRLCAAGDPPVPLWGLAGDAQPERAVPCRCLLRGKERAGVSVPVVQSSIKYRLLSNFLCRKYRNTTLCEHNLCETPRALELALQHATGLISILCFPPLQQH